MHSKNLHKGLDTLRTTDLSSIITYRGAVLHLEEEENLNLFITQKNVNDVRCGKGMNGQPYVEITKLFRGAKMSVTLDRMGEVTVIHIHEKFIDALNAPALKNEIQAFFKPRMLTILDLTQVEFLDSSGMGAILASMRHLNSMEGQLKLAGVSKPVQTLFELGAI